MPARGNADTHDGISVTVALENYRFIDIIGQGATGTADRIPDIVGRFVDVPPRLELNHGAASAPTALRAQRLNAGDP